jgi:hypothetical protein
MKKILLVCTVFMFALAGNVSAQQGKELTIESFSWGATNATGPQTVVIPNGRGTLKFDKNGDKFTNMVFIEPTTLKNHRALLVNTFPHPNMKDACKYRLPNGSFETADKTIAISICKETKLATSFVLIVVVMAK